MSSWGETLSKIAQKHCGDASRGMRIFEASREQPENPDLIEVGQKLRIS
jgi:nucleoid-associated protein YgaU